MEPTKLKALRDKLSARRDELLHEGDIAIDPNRDDPSTIPDEDTQPLTEMNQVIASRRNKNRAMELERIEAALRRIDTEPEDYGLCADCEEEIPYRRLELMPWALYCVECQAARSGGRGGRRRHAADFLD